MTTESAMKLTPTISVITPLYNAVHTLPDTLQSVRAQAGYAWEYIVVDALSTDGSSELIEQASDVVTLHLREADKGLYDAMNKGITQAHGDIICIINADDYLRPGALRAVSDAFADERIDYVFSDLDHVDLHGRLQRTVAPRLDWLQGKTSWLGRDWRMNMAVGHPALFVRRRLYQRLGLYDTRYRLSADHEFVARMIRAGALGHYLKGPALASFRVGGSSTQRMLECFQEDMHIATAYAVPRPLAALLRWNKVRWYHRTQQAHASPSA